MNHEELLKELDKIYALGKINMSLQQRQLFQLIEKIRSEGNNEKV
jgi:hypothetical protein